MWQVVSYFKNGKETISKALSWASAYAMWERKNSRSKRRFSIRAAKVTAMLVLLILVSIPSFAKTSNKAAAKSSNIKQHSSIKMASILIAPVVHPKRTIKQILGSVLFASEPAVDVAHISFNALDAAFAANIKPYEPIHYLAVGSAKLDAGWEKAELFFFGSSN